MIRTEMVDLDKITIGERARSYAYGLDPLERSISENGVIHPIGLDQDYNLIFGFRRYHACKNLGMTQIPAQIFTIDVDDIYRRRSMEWHENIVRIDLSHHERLLMGMYIEEALKGRHGTNQHQPKYDPEMMAEVKAIIDTANKNSQGEERQNFASPPMGKSTDVAAKAVGWSGEKYRQAKAIYTSDNEEVKKAVSEKRMSVNAAHKQLKQRGKKAPNKASTPMTFRITLRTDQAENDAALILDKGGGEYSDKLALTLLKLRGHNVESFTA